MKRVIISILLLWTMANAIRIDKVTNDFMQDVEVHVDAGATKPGLSIPVWSKTTRTFTRPLQGPERGYVGWGLSNKTLLRNQHYSEILIDQSGEVTAIVKS